MIQFIKAQASSFAATAVDFLLTYLLANCAGLWYVIANVIGVSAGGVTNFYINRDWVFEGPRKPLKYQAVKYFVIWLGNLLLNTLGLWLLKSYCPFSLMVSKTITALIVGWTYNYFLQKYYVFK